MEMLMKIHSFAGRGFSSNCYVIRSELQGRGVVVDPSVDYATVARELGADMPAIDLILLTHGHFDHILALDEWRLKTGARVLAHEGDAGALLDSCQSCFMQFYGVDKTFAPCDGLLSEGDLLSIGEESLRVLHTPGHTAGSVCFAGDGFLVTGDTIFADGGVGRTDLPGGSTSSQSISLKRILAMQDDIVLYPGHGAPTTVVAERNNHLYL